MTSLVEIKFTEANARLLDTWDDRVASSVNGTIFHERRFLAYHGSRFAGRERFLVALDGNTPVAQIALAIDDTDEGRVARSPYGASYGGFVLFDFPSFTRSRDLVRALLDYARDAHVQQLIMTPPIPCCATQSLDVLAFAMLTNGFQSVNRDISHVFDLRGANGIAGTVSSRARNMYRKATNLGVTIRSGNFEAFWSIMEKTFAKHSTRPTHTKEEFAGLIESLPGRVTVDVAYDTAGVPLAGIGSIAINPRVNSSFYLCQDPDRQKEQALSALVIHVLDRSRSEGYAWFDFGTSSVNMVARENIVRFKESFTRAAMFRETYQWQAA